MTFSHTTLWIVIISVGLGGYLMRFVFLGVLGDRPLPDWLLRHLRYTGVAVLPALVAPLVLWPEATSGTPDPARLLAAGATLLVGYVTRNTLLAILAGGVSLYVGLGVLG
ncbi:MAG: AzlD domain-containing protein [Roseovarius sp.]